MTLRNEIIEKLKEIKNLGETLDFLFEPNLNFY